MCQWDFNSTVNLYSKSFFVLSLNTCFCFVFYFENQSVSSKKYYWRSWRKTAAGFLRFLFIFTNCIWSHFPAQSLQQNYFYPTWFTSSSLFFKLSVVQFVFHCASFTRHIFREKYLKIWKLLMFSCKHFLKVVNV